jgi:hypothetical protein
MKKRMRKPLGRKPKPRDQKQGERVMVYLTIGERRRLEKLAKAEGLPLATFIRITVLRQTKGLEG